MLAKPVFVNCIGAIVLSPWLSVVPKVLQTILFLIETGERGGSMVERRTPEREVGGSIPTSAVLCP